MQAILLPAEVAHGRHLSAFLISLSLNASPEGSLVFSSTGGFSGVQPPRAQRLPVALTAGGLVKKWDVRGPQQIFFPSGPPSACSFFPVSGYSPSLSDTLWRNAKHLLFPLTLEGVAGTQHLSAVARGHPWALRALSTSQLVRRGSGPGRGSGKDHDKL